jgi:hypothetical protein
VEAIETADDLLDIKVRFESFPLSRHRTDPPITVETAGARMRRLELCDINRKGLARPRFMLVSLLRRPETLISANGLPTNHAGSRRSSQVTISEVARSASVKEDSHGNTTMSPLLHKR